jgi:hypothetical protein
MQTSLGELTPNRRWLATNFCHSVITPVEPYRPAPTQLSLSLTSTQPANRRLAYLPLAWTSGSEQSVPPPPYLASRSARLRIVSCGSSRAS